ncbi:MAG: hypothetical protein KDD47_16890, partial [Acidobacteria bacterium]|nr:hypothetical protein [Acidobacteriota bacterium]
MNHRGWLSIAAVLAWTGAFGPVSGAAQTEACVADEHNLCLLDGRFELSVTWHNGRNGSSGVGGAISGQDPDGRSGFFWFFRPDNVELVVKVLDGRRANGHFWLFYGALSDVEYTLRVRDTATGDERVYHNPAGNLCGLGDTRAFPGEPGLTSTELSSALRQFPQPEPGTLSPAAVSKAPAPDSTGSCVPSPEVLCLLDGRFRIKVDWRDPRTGATGVGGAIPASDSDGRSGFFWFFRPDNVELVVKALDGRGVNGRFWLFYGALSDVGYRLRVTDTVTGAERLYVNPPGNICGRGDTAAFCEDPEVCAAELPRPKLASTPVQGAVGDPLLFAFRDINLGADADVASLHQDFYGVPWQAFADGREPPAEWQARIGEAVQRARSQGPPIYLSLALVGGDGRAYLASRPLATPAGLTTEEEWSERCFNFSTHPDGARWRDAYLAYVRYMVNRIHPAYLTPGIEVNLFQHSCDGTDPGAYDALIGVLNDAYQVAKSVDPELPVFPSLQIGFLGGLEGECANQDPTRCIEPNLERNARLKRDRFAISFYAHLLQAAGQTVDTTDLLEKVLRRTLGEGAVVAETGYPSFPLVVNTGTL